MEQETLRRLIRNKLADGRLPQDSIPRLWGAAGNGETCDACEEIITKTQFVMEGVSTTGGFAGLLPPEPGFDDACTVCAADTPEPRPLSPLGATSGISGSSSDSKTPSDSSGTSDTKK